VRQRDAATRDTARKGEVCLAPGLQGGGSYVSRRPSPEPRRDGDAPGGRRGASAAMVSELAGNAAAVAFWRRVIGEHVGGRFVETVANDEVIQMFDNRP
jgi:hypothetical protein